MPLRFALCALAVLTLLLVPSAAAQDAFINEFHYDNDGGDEGEFVEVAVPDGTDVADLVLTFYNGNNGETYGSASGETFTEGETAGGITLYTVFPSSLQNGSPDGIALSEGGTLLQFLSYEGTFTASGGPADGVESTDVGVEEEGSTPIGESLQLTGDGAAYDDFSWTGPVGETPGAVNDGQTFNGEGGSGGGGGGGEVMLVTIAEARAAGSGETVRVQGTVTRAAGFFLYLQDETGGLAIRQPEGALFDAVAAGDVAPGTVLDVTGTLSEFANLLQINEDDLESFETIGAEDVPAPQVVTLNDLSLNGEDFEGELVRVVGVTIDPDSDDEGTDPDGTFTARSTYQVEDGSGAVGTVTLRIPNADDTTVDGTDIPAVADLTGIVGQYDFDSAVNGYQLLVLDAADVEPRDVATEGGPGAALAITVENPVRGRAAVRFAAGAPGVGTLALYDVLGRRVRTLADGPVGPAAQAVTLDAAGLAAGVYVLRLEADGGAVGRVITVVR